MYVRTFFELNFQDIGGIGRIFRVLGHHVQVGGSVLLKNTHIHSISHTFHPEIALKRRERRREYSRQLQRRRREEDDGRKGDTRESYQEVSGREERKSMFYFSPLFGFTFLTLAFRQEGREKSGNSGRRLGNTPNMILWHILSEQRPPQMIFPSSLMKVEIRLHFLTCRNNSTGCSRGAEPRVTVPHVCPAMRPRNNYTALGQDDGQCPLSWGKLQGGGGLCKITTGCI